MKIKKSTISKLLTYLMVLVVFGFVYHLDKTGQLTRHLQKMLVPICINIILAISLNITVGFLGELTLGHAGFMSVGAYGGCLFAIHMQDILPSAIRFPLALLVGGLVAAMVGMLIYAIVLDLGFPQFRVNYGIALLYGLIGSAAGVFGDLCFSIIKRQTGIKDYGNLIPGHGGVLDRFDSLMMVAPLMEAMLLLAPVVI